ncbi:hypothetical protein [Candidatus Thiodiazotropha sp. CDECU1]|uniref:hypothetical protein n=1 Tax=Candidatus Thiodiazotropha sp. CDECU1 TaxID=3065865 RepID=UPI00292EE467|nr:hypothetical protein [Candidatus Thiodiazotropha sp. CDECU1]
MTPQSTFMILAEIHEGQVEVLRSLLATMNQVIGHADPDNPLLPFAHFERLHVARFVILEAKTADEIRYHGRQPYPWQPALVFLGDCDGEGLTFLDELAQHAGEGLTKIFSHCEEFDPQRDDLLAWMVKRNISPQANYVNWIGRSVKQIREEQALQRSLADYLPTAIQEVGRNNTLDLRQKLLTHVELEIDAGRLRLTPPEPTPKGWWISNLVHKIGLPLILLLIAPILLLLAPFLIWRLRMLERADPEIVIRPGRSHIASLSVREDLDVTNQFNVLGDVKPGLFRLMLLKFLLLTLDYASRHIYNHGYLTRVKTIHFARWVLIDNNRRLYFASNYDGSLEGYMDDFINKVAWGLNLVFSNGVGYPKTSWLIKQGAEREQQFKYTLRRHQLPSEVWYKAYPGLSAFDLARNSRIRQGVEVRQSSDQEIRAWLSLI